MISLLCVIFAALALAGLWKTFIKAGRQGWEGIVPFYNIYIMVQMIKKPILWFILCLVPCISIVFLILVCIEFAKQFGKSAGFGVGLALLSFVFWPILGFGDAKFIGLAAVPPAPGAAPPAPPAAQ